MQRESGRSRVIRRQQLEEQEKLAELEQRRLSELNLTSKPLSRPSYFVGSMEAVVTEGLLCNFVLYNNNSLFSWPCPLQPMGHFFYVYLDGIKFSMTDHFSNALDASNNVSPNNNKSRHCSNSHGDQERYSFQNKLDVVCTF